MCAFSRTGETTLAIFTRCTNSNGFAGALYLFLDFAIQPDWLVATVYVTELMGNETIAFLQVGEERLVAHTAAEFRAPIETKIWLKLATDKALFFDTESDDAIWLS